VKILRLVLLGLAALAGIVAGTALFQKAVQRESPYASLTATAIPLAAGGASDSEAVRRIFQNTVKGAPEYGDFFDRFKAAFPAEYEAFLKSVAERSAASGEIGSADLLLAEAVRTLRLSRGVLAANAGQPALERIFDLQLAMLSALAVKDPRLCAEYLNGGESSGYFEFAAENRKLVAKVANAGIDAILDGALKQVHRDTPTEKDFDAVEVSLRSKGLGSAEVEALLDGTVSNPPVGNEKMCRAGQVYLETLATMPEEVRLRIYGLAAGLMARY